MKLRYITGSCIKGHNFTHQLGAVNLITGQPFTGKSSRLEAIRLLLMGYVPELGKTNQATFSLASGPMLEIEGLLDGQHVGRSWTRTGKGISAESHGEFPEIPPVLMDPQVYFSLGPKDQVRYVFGLAKVDESFNVDQVIAALKNLSFDPNTETTQKAINEVVGYVDESDRERHDANGSIQDWVDALLAKYSEQRKLVKSAIKEMTGTITGMARLRSAEASVGRDMQPEIERLNQEITRLSVEAERASNSLTAKQAQKAERSGLEAKVAEAGEVQDNEPEFDRLRELLTKLHVDKERVMAEHKQLSEAQAQRKALLAKLATMENFSQDELDATAIEVEAYKSKTPSLEAAWKKAMGLKATTGGKHLAAKDELELYKTEKAKLDGVPCCPTCGATGETLRELVAAKYAEILAELSAVEQAAKKAYEEAQAAFTKAEKAYQKSQEQDQQHQNAQAWLAEWRLKNQAYANMLARIAELPEVTDEQLSQISQQHVTLSTNLQNAQAKLWELQTAQRAYQAVQTARARMAEIPAVTDDELNAIQSSITDLSGKLVQARQSLQTAQQAQKAFQAAKQDKARLAQAELDQRAKEESLKVLDAVVKYFDGLKADMVTTAFGGLLEKANQVAGPILKSPLVYRDGQLGRMVGHQFVGVETFSGTERAVTYAGLSVALAWESPLKIVLMDELGALGPDYLPRLLEIMLDLTAKGFIDQFVGVSITAPETVADGVNLISL